MVTFKIEIHAKGISSSFESEKDLHYTKSLPCKLTHIPKNSPLDNTLPSINRENTIMQIIKSNEIIHLMSYLKFLLKSDIAF